MANGPSRENPKKVFIKTYGCQMNVYDSQRISDTLLAQGYAIASQIEDADLVLLNTCHIREKASEKVYSDLGRIRKVKQKRENQGKRTFIGVAGCVAQAEGEEIIRRAPVVDLVIGPQVLHRLVSSLKRVESGERVLEVEHVTESKFERMADPQKAHLFQRGVTAFLTVQEGCDKFCSFCVVPYTRGAENSRPAEAIIKEAERLAEAGVREVTLLGQNVNAWKAEGPDGKIWGLGKLLFRLAEIPGLARLRYTTSHPRDMGHDLIEAHRDLDALMPYLHLPVQSGSDPILKAMNRRYTVDEYKRLVESIRMVRPDIALSGDFIVGFPGETDKDFEQTIQLVRDIKYAAGFSFTYSPRPGTPAADIEEDLVEERTKDERLQQLQALLAQQRMSFAQGLIGRKLETLLEKPGRQPQQIVGRSPWLQPVIVDEKAGKPGDILSVMITRTDVNALYGEIPY